MLDYLHKASEDYYNGKPIMSDEQFDVLAERFGYNDVGAKPAGKVQKHFYQMYSLQKHYADEGEPPLHEYPDSVKVRSPKLDGAALDITYVDGVLFRVLTRGDGVEGQDVTDKFLVTALIPPRIRLEGVVQVTGEIVSPKALPNARNYAAGSVNLKDVEEFRTRAVTFFAYGVYPSINKTFTEDLEMLRKLGFYTVWDKGLTDIYPTDGIVVRLNDNAEFERLGYTAKFPRGAYALKERGVAVETELLDVVWQVGRSGKVTPVAILQPVYVGDALVSRATLDNQSFIEALDLHIGDRVGIIRSGEIIPKIVYRCDA